jgi:transcription elongation GreA/GreB family factor
MNKKNVITPEGYLALKKKIARLEKEQIETAERLNLTRGDVSENTDFTLLEAKNSNLLKEIEESKIILEKARICEKISNKSFSGLGSIITYLWLNRQEKLTTELTDNIIANPPHKISVNSPLGEKLLEKKVGDIIQLGKNKYQVLEIK